MDLESCNIGFYHSGLNDFFFCDIITGNRGSRSTEISSNLICDGDLDLLRRGGDTGLSLEDLEDERANPRLMMPINLVMFKTETEMETEE